MSKFPAFNHADAAGPRPVKNNRQGHGGNHCGRGDCPKKHGGRLPSCPELEARARAWEMQARKAEVGRQRVLTAYAELKAENERLRALLP